MAAESEHLEVLAAYPDDCQPNSVESLHSAGGFSGAKFWRLYTPSGALCLRRWPREHPTVDGLEFIQAVLWHVAREGFRLSPLPRETSARRGYVRHGGFLWELAPWMPGRADFRERPSAAKLTAAMIVLAEFHLAAATFPLPNLPSSPSPGIQDRLNRLQEWISGGLAELTQAVKPGLWPELEPRVERILQLVPALADNMLSILNDTSRLGVSLQPCIRDVWHEHVLFDGDRVSGLIDFGSMRPDNVACDVARLLGSMALDNAGLWKAGLDSYQSVRPLSESEIALVEAFDQSTLLMAGLNWIDWIYRQRRVFENRKAIPQRLDDILVRLESLHSR